MSLTIKKKSNFKPKAAPRRPVGPSTQTSARPSVERQSQTPNPSIPTETLSVPGRTQEEEVPREPSITEYTPQSTSSEITSQRKQQTIHHADQGVPAPSENLSDQHHPSNNPSSGSDEASQRETLHTELPTQTPTASVRVSTSETQTASLKRKDAPDENVQGTAQKKTRTGDAEPVVEVTSSKRKDLPDDSLAGTAQKRTRIELPASSTEESIPEVIATSIHADHSTLIPPGSSDTTTRASQNEAQTETTNTSVEHGESAVTAPNLNKDNLVQPSDIRQDNPSSIYPDPELSRTSGGATSQLPHGADFPTDQPLQTIGTAAINPDGSASTSGQVVHTAGMNPDGTAGQAVPKAAARPRKKKASRKAKASAAVVGDDDPNSTRAGIEMTLNKTRRVPGEKRDRKKKGSSKGRKKRAETPEGAEDEEVDPAIMTLEEICKDPKIGKRFSRTEQIKKQMLEREKEKKRQKKENERLWGTTLTDDEAEGEEEGNIEGEPEAEAEEGDNEERAPFVEKLQEPAPVISGPQMVVGPDGRITIVQSSLQFNRNAAAEFARDGEQEQQVDDFSRLVNSGSHVKRTPKRDWTVIDEEKFWEILREYGTDFEMMAATLGRGRTARQCKLKFRKEEKLNPAKIDRAFRGIPEPVEDEDLPGVSISQTATPEEVPLGPGDLVQKYKREIEASLGERLEDPAAIMESLEAARKAQELAEQEAERAIEAENARKEQDIISGQDRRNRIANGLAVDDESGNQENGGPSNGREASAAPRAKQKATRKGKKNPHSSGAYGGGTEFIIESTEA